MRLTEIRVKNFRGLGGEKNAVNFETSNVIFLIGQNDVGKSSFLKAYEFFLNSKQKAAKEDFFQYDPTNYPIEIEADFRQEEGDPENPDFANEPEWVSKWVQTDTGLITIKKVWSEEDQLYTKYTKNSNGEFVKNGFGGMDTLTAKYAPTPVFINGIETVETLEKKVNDIIEKEHLKKL